MILHLRIRTRSDW